MRFNTRTLLVSLLASSLLMACGKKEETYIDKPVDEIYAKAKRQMDKEEYLKAAQTFEEVERHHPYSNWAAKSKLMSAFAYYEAMKYDDAIVALDGFIQMHPGHEDIAYAYYLRGLSYYEQIADVRRDQSLSEQAYESFKDLTRRFPESKYSRDAQLKISLLEDHLAGKEMNIGRFYHRKGHHQAAITRFQRVITDFQSTSHVPEALHRLTESYVQIGLMDEAEATASVLGYNYPGSDWYEDSYALLRQYDRGPHRKKKSWIAKAWKALKN